MVNLPSSAEMMDENRASVLETPGVTVVRKTGKTGSIRIDLASDFI